MSAIASFHVLASQDLASLLETEEVHSFLEDTATELRPFGYSGYVFNDLDFLLEPRGVPLTCSLRLRDACQHLSERMGATFLLYDYETAQALLAGLRSIELRPDEVEAYLKTERGTTEPGWVEAILSALAQTQEWLAQVPPEGIGILTVG